MSTTTKSIYTDPSGPLELALLLSETKVFILELVCRSYSVKDFALKQLGFQACAGLSGVVGKDCPACGGVTSLKLDLKTGLADCSACKKASDLVRLTRSGRCTHLITALDYLVNALLAGALTEKKRFVRRLEAFTQAVYASLIYPYNDGRTVRAILADNRERECAGGLR